MKNIFKSKKLIHKIILGLLLLTNTSCSLDEEPTKSSGEEHEDEQESAVSIANGNDSHNFGKNCFSCHISGSGSEASEYQFTIAGSVKNSSTGSALIGNSGGVIKLYDSSNTLVKTLPIDSKGNFYSTEKIQGLGSLYAEVSLSGSTQRMSNPAPGKCGVCHNSDGVQGLIYVP